MEKDLNADELKSAIIKMALQHAKISVGEVPEDETELDDHLDDMWYSFAIPDFENSPTFENIKIDKLIAKLKLEDLYKQTAKEALKKRYKLSF